MAASKVEQFQLPEGMQLQIYVFGSSNGRNVRVEFHLRNCKRTWILHWGCVYRGNPNWFVPSEQFHRQGALQTPFVKSGNSHIVIIELQDPKIHAIEFVIKDGGHDRWLKLNHKNFRIEIPQSDAATNLPIIPKNLIEARAYKIWESKGRPQNSPQQQQEDYNQALRELQMQLQKGMSLDELQMHLQKGMSLNELQSSNITPNSKPVAIDRKQPNSVAQASYHRRYNVEKWLQKDSKPHDKSANSLSSSFMNMVLKTFGGDNVLLQRSYSVGKHEIAAISRNVKGDSCILVATNMKGTLVLHWGVSKWSAGEWLNPPPELLPGRSKMVHGACQTYFTEVSTREGSYQVVEVNMRQKDFVGIQFVIWSDGTWIKDNGANFFFGLKSAVPGIAVDQGSILKWLLDEISQREKEAERSLMHRFNIATELTERCNGEGDLGLIGIMVWMRFMACRHLTWNKNYNVKPREISEALNRFNDLLSRIYLKQPGSREIIRLTMASVGRGGQGDVGQRIRDEILVLQRNNDCKTGMIEEWHQKLHNNSSPDDVIICEALLNYLRADFNINVYWKTLNANGLTKEKLASYDRPIVSEPRFRHDAKEGLICDLSMYLKTLKAVHSGGDLESAIESLGSPLKGHNFAGTAGLSMKLQDCLNYVKAHIHEENIAPLMEKLIEARIELYPMLLTHHTKTKDLLFLDLALTSTARTTVERGFKAINFTNPPEVMFFISLALENICLSTVNNEDIIYCTKDWYRVCEAYKPNDVQWALQTKAVSDRLQLALAERGQNYHRRIQPSAQYLGHLLGVQKGAIDAFTDEVLRAGTGPVISMLINSFDHVLRKAANLGSWQIISSADARGIVVCVDELIKIQSKVYSKPTIIIAKKVTGEEEIPSGAVALLTPSTPDVLSHVLIHARNSKICFATCFDHSILSNLKLKEGRLISIEVKSTNLVISDIRSSTSSYKFFRLSSITRGVFFKTKTFCGKYAVTIEEFTSETVGAKSWNIRFLRDKVPSWINIPISMAIPFGVFENVLSDSINKGLSYRISSMKRSLSVGDLSKLKPIQEAVLQMRPPPAMVNELKSKMRSSRIPWRGDEESWKRSWLAIKKVWASKWNERAYISCQKAKANHDNICMAVLIQQVICADYAFVIHTKNPVSGDSSEIYTEVVKGLGETLVGAYPGRAMSFITKKTNLKSSTIVTYPSKLVGLYSKASVIFRSDSNSEDLEGYAGAGLYDSILMDEAERVVLDYASDRMVIDKAFQTWLFSRIAETGKIIESLYGSPQDIEGVVKDGNVYVVQSRPQV